MNKIITLAIIFLVSTFAGWMGTDAIWRVACSTNVKLECIDAESGLDGSGFAPATVWFATFNYKGYNWTFKRQWPIKKGDTLVLTYRPESFFFRAKLVD